MTRPLAIRRRALALALVVLSGCQLANLAQNNPITGGELSVKREREVTADVAAQIREGAPFLRDPVLLAYVNDIGQRIVGVTEPQPFIYRFAVLDDDHLNAFTIGGGYVYLNSGVVAQAGNVSELAGVIAHEIAHVRRRHIARRNEGQTLATLATLAALAAVALAGADPGTLVLAQGLNVALQLKNSRAAETDADREGVDYMIRAGFDPVGMVRFFERIAAESPAPGAEIPAYVFTHPAVKERVRATEVLIERLELPAGLEREDAKLTDIQGRMAKLSEPIAGGSGLLARARFDREATDPLLASAQTARENGDADGAEAALRAAVRDYPTDPRIWLELADLAQARDDDPTAAEALEHAFQLDSNVPLVQYQLGLVHQRLGNRSLAVFYLEQALQGFRPGTSGRKRAQFAIDQMVFPVLDSSGLANASGEASKSFRQGEPVLWHASIHSHFLPRNPVFVVEWHDPSGAIAAEERLRMNPLGNLHARLDTAQRATGTWKLVVRVDAAQVDEHEFELLAAAR